MMMRLTSILVATVFALSTDCVAGNDGRNCTAYTGDGQPCSIPFVYKGTSYHKCTNVDHSSGTEWCSLTPNFDIDKKWKRCGGVNCGDCNVYAQNGRKCVFPFTYNGVQYHYCTGVDNKGRLWCSFTASFQGQWGHCGDTLCGECTVPTPRGKQCTFPFFYKNIQYEYCTRRDHDRPWCSLNGYFRQRGVDWDNCRTPQCSEKPVLLAPTTTGEEQDICDGFTVRGFKCALPFIYKGITYYGPTDVDNDGRKWCSLTPSFDTDQKWQNYFGTVCDGCEVKIENGALCHLPFVYKGRTFEYCTKFDSERLWCSLDAIYDGKWGYCTRETVCKVETTAGPTSTSPTTVGPTEEDATTFSSP